jgi:hypothetical protein
MFITELLTVVKLWNQPMCPKMNEWIRKMWEIHTMKYYFAKKKNEIMTLAGKWMELVIIKLNKIIQSQKIKYYMYSLICGTQT